MFARAEGPSSLRLDLVWALAFSLSDATIDTPKGEVEVRAGVAAIWNGRKGEVVVLLRQISPPDVQRLSYKEAIASVEDLEGAVDSALGYLQTLGFMVDSAEFRSLGASARKARVRSWDALRKVRPGRRKVRPGRRKGGGKADAKRKSRGAPPTAEAASSGASATVQSPPVPGAAPQKAVLGRMSLVRRGGSGGRAIDPVGWLLSFF